MNGQNGKSSMITLFIRYRTETGGESRDKCLRSYVRTRWPCPGGPQCYSCQDTINPDQCKTTRQCNINQACSVQEVFKPHGDLSFWSGCEELHICADLPAYSFDHAAVVGKRHFTYQHRCSYCCYTNACNANCTTYVNLARNKPVFQSSVLAGGTPQHAVDGDENTDFSKGSCISTTGQDSFPWWTVDLGHVFNVSTVKIYETNIPNDHRVFDAEILLSVQNATTLDRTSAHFKRCQIYSPVKFSVQGNTLTITCPRDTAGRWVRIQMTSPAREVLTFCEVEVYGF